MWRRISLCGLILMQTQHKHMQLHSDIPVTVTDRATVCACEIQAILCMDTNNLMVTLKNN